LQQGVYRYMDSSKQLAKECRDQMIQLYITMEITMLYWNMCDNDIDTCSPDLDMLDWNYVAYTWH